MNPDTMSPDRRTGWARPYTPNTDTPDGARTITCQRHCNGCGGHLGDVTDHEIDALVRGLGLPDARAECFTCTPALTRGDYAAVPGAIPNFPLDRLRPGDHVAVVPADTREPLILINGGVLVGGVRETGTSARGPWARVAIVDQRSGDVYQLVLYPRDCTIVALQLDLTARRDDVAHLTAAIRDTKPPSPRVAAASSDLASSLIAQGWCAAAPLPCSPT